MMSAIGERHSSCQGIAKGIASMVPLGDEFGLELYNLTELW